MTLAELKSQISFESGVMDIDALGGWLDLVIPQTLDQLTSKVRYEDLYVPNAVLTPSGPGVGTMNLPSDFQHFDERSVRIRIGGDIDQETELTYMVSPHGLNTGRSRFVYLNSTLGSFNVSVWPYGEVGATDTFLFNYWRKASTFALGDSTIIYPIVLISTLVSMLSARINLVIGGGKGFAAFQSLAKEAYSASMASTNIGDING